MRKKHFLLCAALMVYATAAAQRKPETTQSYYMKWLNEDVVYIITEPERAVFLSLTTDEERERFIEQFWERRNPEPRSGRNPFKEEHYRRIAYANERFAAGKPGWMTDRGRIYIKYGEPNGLERRPTGGTYTRPITEGGGTTTVHPYEKWRYNYIEGVGQNIEIEFVDEGRTGDYRIALSPQQKDALLMVPGAGLTEWEEMGLETRADRLLRDGLGVSAYPAPSRDQPFQRLAQLGALTRPPEFRFKDLKAAVEAHLSYSQVPMRVASSYLRIADDRALVMVAVEIANSDLKFATLGSIYRAEVEIYGRLSDLAGRTAAEFEDTVHSEHNAERHERALSQKSLYQKLLTLAPGNYKLELTVRDRESKAMGTTQTLVAVPKPPQQGMSCSPIILASRIERVSGLSTSVEQFALGDIKVVPNLERAFPRGDIVGVYLQAYGASIDEAAARPSLSIRYHVMQGGRAVRPPIIDDVGRTVRFVSDKRVVLVTGLGTDSLELGAYRLLVKIRDNISGQEASAEANFTVTPQMMQ